MIYWLFHLPLLINIYFKKNKNCLCRLNLCVSFMRKLFSQDYSLLLFKQQINGQYQPSSACNADCLQHLTTHIIQNGQRGLERVLTLGYWTLRSTFAKQVFRFDHSFYENLKKNSKWPPGGPKMANGVWRGVYP